MFLYKGAKATDLMFNGEERFSICIMRLKVILGEEDFNLEFDRTYKSGHYLRGYI